MLNSAFDGIGARPDDLAAATATLTQHGVEFVRANQPLNAARSSTMLRDPEGNLINIFGPRSASV